MYNTGKLITVEGIEGAGKSTALEVVATTLEARGIDLRRTREPGGTPLGEDIRGLLLDRRHSGMGPDSELLLMFAARAEHLSAVIQPALERGTWVVCDRFTDASYAYQGGGRGVATSRIETLEVLVQGAVRPDLTLLLDCPAATGLARAGERGAADRFESETEAFFERARATYLARARAEPERFHVIDAARAWPQVEQAVTEALEAYCDRVVAP